MEYRGIGEPRYRRSACILNIPLKVENILKGSLDLIPSPSKKIKIMGGKVCLKCKSKTLLGDVNKLLKKMHFWLDHETPKPVVLSHSCLKYLYLVPAFRKGK